MGGLLPLSAEERAQGGRLVANREVEQYWKARPSWKSWQPEGMPPLTAVAVGYDFVCGLDRSGAVRCLGSNLSGQLGDGSQHSRLEPRRVSLPATATDVAADGFSACAATKLGVYCWGSLLVGHGELHEPELVENSRGLVTVSLADDLACGLTARGEARCWGRNRNGRLGDGTKLDRKRATAVRGVVAAQELVLSEDFACFLVAKGDVICHGSDLGKRPRWSLSAEHIYLYASRSDSFLVAARVRAPNRYVLDDASQYLTYQTQRIPDDMREAAGVKGWTCGRVAKSGDVHCYADDEHVVTGTSAVHDIDLGAMLGCGIAGGTLVCWRNEE